MYFSAIVDTIRDNVFDNVSLFTKVSLHFIRKTFRLYLCVRIFIDTLRNDYIIIRLFYVKIFQQIRKISVCVDYFILEIMLIFCRYVV